MDTDSKFFKMLPWGVFLILTLSLFIEGFGVFISGTFNPYANPGTAEWGTFLGGQLSGGYPLSLLDWIVLQFVIEAPVITILTIYIIKLWKE